MNWRDAVQTFFREYTKDDPEGVVQLSELYNLYIDFCKSHGVPAVSKFWIGRYLSKKGYIPVIVGGKRGYRGIALR